MVNKLLEQNRKYCSTFLSNWKMARLLTQPKSDKPAKLFMGDGSLTENFERRLLGLQAGDEKSFELAPEDAFGQPNPDNIYYVDRSKFGADTPAEVGTIIAFTQPDGTELPGLVREVAGDSVTIDFNHPLAGQRVTFEVEILEVKN